MKTGSPHNYAPLSARAVRRILEFDRAAGFGLGGTLPNRNRFYIYLTQCKSDVQIRTVAVKAPKRTSEPVLKEVALSSVDDPWIHVKDLGCYAMAGYAVDWSPEGFGMPYYWCYKGRWESEAYALRCSWKINAPVVNPELLKRTRRFKWSDWQSSRAHILDYLKVFSKHPEIEFLSKVGLGKFCTKVSIVRKLKADRKFRQFFSRHADEIKECCCTVPAIFKAYRTGASLGEVQREIAARREFQHVSLPGCVSAVKAASYVATNRIQHGHYADYLNNCKKLGHNLADTKVAFPKNFKRRQRIVRDYVDVELNHLLAAVAEAWAASLSAHKTSAYRVVIPRSGSEMANEGSAMSNCLGESDYASKVAQGESLILFIRKAERQNKAFVAVEFCLKRNVIAQCYGAKNSRPPKKVREFVDRLFSAQTKLKDAA